MATAPQAQRTAGVIDFGRQFGSKNQPAEQREDAKIWINIGYYVEVPVTDAETGAETVETRFISLPVGIALDNMEPVKLGNNANFNALQSARNDLLAQLKAAAEGMTPGQEETLDLNIQIRRVKDKAEAVASENNPYSAKLDLFVKK